MHFPIMNILLLTALKHWLFGNLTHPSMTNSCMTWQSTNHRLCGGIMVRGNGPPSTFCHLYSKYLTQTAALETESPTAATRSVEILGKSFWLHSCPSHSFWSQRWKVYATAGHRLGWPVASPVHCCSAMAPSLGCASAVLPLGPAPGSPLPLLHARVCFPGSSEHSSPSVFPIPSSLPSPPSMLLFPEPSTHLET